MGIREAVWVGVALLAGLECFACSSTEDESGSHLMLDATVAESPMYCANQCQNEQNLGTLVGTLAACETECCQTTPSGCPAKTDGGTGAGGTNPEAGPSDAGNGADADAATMGMACTNTSQCPGGATASCCEKQADGTGRCASVNDAGAQVCFCQTPNDCASSDGFPGCCAPQTSPAGDPTGPYVCKPDDGQNYDCCYQNDCNSNYCCVIDPQTNQFCALACTGTSGCGQAKCLSTYMFDYSVTSCAVDTSSACGP